MKQNSNIQPSTSMEMSKKNQENVGCGRGEDDSAPSSHGPILEQHITERRNYMYHPSP
jgi:hypothetical protein